MLKNKAFKYHEKILVRWIKNNPKKFFAILLILIGLFLIIIFKTPELLQNGVSEDPLSIKSFGAKGDGHSDDTAALETALNSESDLYIPRGNYKISRTITIKPGKSKRVLGEKGTVISISLKEGQDFLQLKSNISFEYIEFDFNYGPLKNGIIFDKNLGEVSLKKLVFKNIKDTNSSIGTNILYILTEGNRLNVQDIHFDNMQKQGNGIVGDAGGNITGLYVRGSGSRAEALGHIEGVRVTNVHNVNGTGEIIFEDTSGIYVITSENDKKNDLKIENTYGYNFGKRLIKLHASNVKVLKVDAYSDKNDSFSAIGVNSGAGMGIKVNNVITDVKIRGKYNAALTTAGSSTTFRDLDINIEKSDLVSNRPNGVGVFISNDKALVENSEINAPTPIEVKRYRKLPIKNSKVIKSILYVSGPTVLSNQANQLSSAYKGIDELIMEDVIIKPGND